MVLTENPRSVSSTCKKRSTSWCIPASDPSPVADGISGFSISAAQECELVKGHLRERRVIHRQGFRNARVRNFPVDHVDTSGEFRITRDGSLQPVISQR